MKKGFLKNFVCGVMVCCLAVGMGSYVQNLAEATPSNMHDNDRN